MSEQTSGSWEWTGLWRLQARWPFGRGSRYVKFDDADFCADRQPGWRKTIVFWIFVTLAVLLTNITLLVWLSYQPKPVFAPAYQSNTQTNTSTIFPLFQGNCLQAGTIKTWSHLGINLLSTLLLTASTNCMQCLSSPTRQEIDAAHATGHHLDVNILSIRNLTFIPRNRRVAWFLLAISSLPLHFFYNSIIITSVASNHIPTFVVSGDYVTQKPLNVTDIASFFSWEVNATVSALHQPYPMLPNIDSGSVVPTVNQSGFKSIDRESCISAFQAKVVTGYKGVAVLTSLPTSSEILSLSWSGEYQLDSPLIWSCHNSSSYDASVCQFSCSNDTTRYCEFPTSFTTFSAIPDNSIDRCIVQTAEELCTVQVSFLLLVSIVMANVIKAGVMIHTLRLFKFSPIITVGDAVRSFLLQPDETTAGSGQRSQAEFRKRADEFPPCSLDRARIWVDRPQRWFSAVSKKRWISSVGVCSVLITVAVALIFVVFGSKPSLVESQRAGFGGIDPRSASSFDSSDITTVAVLSNVPQILVSLAYTLYYGLISSMAITSDMSDFAVHRRTLRVSPPRQGLQRSTYWLTIPLRYSLPVMAATVLLHWMVSQAIFILRIDSVQNSGEVMYGSQTGIGYSLSAMVAAIAWGTAIMILPVLLGFLRLPSGSPIIGHNSLAIAANCCRDPTDSADMSSLPLMYGVLPTPGKDGRRRVGFSSGPVEPLLDGESYESTKCLGCIRSPLSTWHRCGDEDADLHLKPPSSNSQHNLVGRASSQGLSAERQHLYDNAEDSTTATTYLTVPGQRGLKPFFPK